MIFTVYIIILIYFFLGAFITYYINKKKDKSDKEASYKKFIIYFLIVNIIVIGIIISEIIFRCLAIIIVTISFVELIKLFYQNRLRQKVPFFINSVLIYIFISTGFIFFSFMQKELILYAFFLVMVSDASSQQSGKLFGKQKIFPKTSPNKTLEGLIGGILISLLTSVLIHDLINVNILISVTLSLLVSVMAILGDLLASFYKRKFCVKDFSKLIPGHGGFLDRFDSFLMVGAFIFIFFNFIYST